MKKIGYFFLLLLFPFFGVAQDTLTLIDGRKIPCKIVNVDSVNISIEELRDGETRKSQIAKSEVSDILFQKQKPAESSSRTSIVENNRPSTITFYRLPNFVGSAVKMKILRNELPIVRLKNNSYYQYELPPGSYTFSCKMANSTAVKLTVEPGRSYYIKCYINQGFWSGIPVLEVVDSLSGEAVITGATLNRQEFAPISLIPPLSRFGLLMGAGGGFEDINIGYTTTGEQLTLSTGGGVVFGLEYGREMNRYFDLSFNWSYQSTSMVPVISNGTASFDRMVILVTPALIIPIKSGDYYKFRLGGGVGYYSLGTMNYNFAKVPGGADLVLKYEPSIGYHTSLIFETRFTEKASFTFGMKYYNVQYKYTKVGSNGYLFDPKGMAPDGSGLDLVMGFNFHF